MDLYFKNCFILKIEAAVRATLCGRPTWRPMLLGTRIEGHPRRGAPTTTIPGCRRKCIEE